MSRFSLSLVMTCSLVLGALPGADPPRPQPGRKFALLVGVTEYDHARLEKLRFTENDVEELAALLRAPGAGFDDVRVLTASRGKKDPRLTPTAANLRQSL